MKFYYLLKTRYMRVFEVTESKFDVIFKKFEMMGSIWRSNAVLKSKKKNSKTQKKIKWSKLPITATSFYVTPSLSNN